MNGQADLAGFAAIGARRLFLLGGIGLILTGMFFGDIFAVFTLHQNAARVGANLAAAAQGALAGDRAAVLASFQAVGSLLENRGTKVDTHVHMIDFGYLALLLAILQPWVVFTERAKKRMAWTFLAGGWALPVGVYLIHYVGLAHSPLQSIGWASIGADLGGLLVLVATVMCLAGLVLRRQNSAELTAGTGVPCPYNHERIGDPLLGDRSVEGRILFAGGIALVLLGFLHGAYYAGTSLYEHEARDYSLLGQMSGGAASGSAKAVATALGGYGQLKGEKAVNIAAHAHAIEFGMLAMMLAFFQPYVRLSARWKRRWARALLAGSIGLPVCVLLELRFGLLAGGVADLAGLLVILALLAMWIGILRYTGELDARIDGERGTELGR